MQRLMDFICWSSPPQRWQVSRIFYPWYCYTLLHVWLQVLGWSLCLIKEISLVWSMVCVCVCVFLCGAGAFTCSLYHSTSLLDLRRMNMRSVVGKKDVFLSYAHINVQFALHIKVRSVRLLTCIPWDVYLYHFLQNVLNENGYTVWIDTAGIRAGQKWRTEIAHGIHVRSTLMLQVFSCFSSPGLPTSSVHHDTAINQLSILPWWGIYNILMYTIIVQCVEDDILYWWCVALSSRGVQEAHHYSEVWACRRDGPRPQTHHSKETGNTEVCRCIIDVSRSCSNLTRQSQVLCGIVTQWVDFSDATQFTDSCTKLLAAVQALIGTGSGSEKYVKLKWHCTHLL